MVIVASMDEIRVMQFMGVEGTTQLIQTTFPTIHGAHDIQVEVWNPKMSRAKISLRKEKLN